MSSKIVYCNGNVVGVNRGSEWPPQNFEQKSNGKRLLVVHSRRRHTWVQVLPSAPRAQAKGKLRVQVCAWEKSGWCEVARVDTSMWVLGRGTPWSERSEDFGWGCMGGSLSHALVTDHY